MNISSLVKVLVFVYLACEVRAWFSLRRPSIRRLPNPLQMGYRPTTYTSINIPTLGGEELLVKSTETAIINTILSWSSSDENNEKLLQSWIEGGHAFWANKEGISSLFQSESIKRKKDENMVAAKIEPEWQSGHSYVNCGTDSDPVYITKRMYSKLVNDRVIPSSLPLSKDTTQLLIDQGIAMSNTTQLFHQERILNRADDIAMRIKAEFPISSPEFIRWSNKTTQYNTTSLAQAVSLYAAEHSVGDVGGEDADYVPKAGYIGTLAPGENFEESHPMNKLPNKVLHPWPAMQEIPFHVRWPPSHPMTPPPQLWFALNNMYTEEFTASELARPRHSAIGTNLVTTPTSSTDGSKEKPQELIIGGFYMEPRDAIKIARGATFGRSYEPSEQLEHGGMLFDSGENIPFYNPDHGPTVSAAEAKIDLPESLRHIMDWAHPASRLAETGDGPIVEFELLEQIDAEEEEEKRRLLAERIMNGQHVPKTEIAAREEQIARDKEVERRLSLHKEARAMQQQEKRDSARRERDMLLAEAKAFDPSIVTTKAENELAFSQRTTTVLLNMNIKTATIVNEDEQEERIKLQNKFRRMYAQREDTENSADSTGNSVEENDDEMMRSKITHDILREEEIARGIGPNGRVRTQSELNKFTIDSSETMIERIYSHERANSGAKKRLGRRRSQRSTDTDDVESSEDVNHRDGSGSVGLVGNALGVVERGEGDADGESGGGEEESVNFYEGSDE